MRRASIRMASLGLAVAALALTATSASAAPTVTLKVKAVPIPVNPEKASPTYPGTGNILGAGAAIESQFTIKGTEYGGFPLPLKRVVFYLPAGTKLHPQGFAKCPMSVLETHEIQNCPKKSVAGPVGTALGVVSFGGTRVPETVYIHSFFTSGGLAFFAEGRTPASIEILSSGNIAAIGGQFGQKLTAEVPLVATVPGAPYGVVESIKVKVGAAFKKGKKLISYGYVPKKCPKGGFKVKAELSFGAEEGVPGETVPVSTTVPCPRK